MYRWGGSRGWGEGLWMGEYLSRCSRPSPHQTHVQPHTQIQAHTCTDNQRAHWNDNLHSQTSPTRPKPSSTAWEEKKRDMSASVHSSVDAARKKPAAFIACNASSDPAWKAKNQQFPSNRSKRFSENMCHCKTCLHALLAHAGIHSLIAETTKIVYSTEYFVFVCLVNHNCKILSCREMSYIGANNIAFTSAADEPKMHTAVRRSSKPWALRVAPSTFFFTCQVTSCTMWPTMPGLHARPSNTCAFNYTQYIRRKIKIQQSIQAWSVPAQPLLEDIQVV